MPEDDDKWDTFETYKGPPEPKYPLWFERLSKFFIYTLLMAFSTAAFAANPEVKVELKKGEDKAAIESTNGTTFIAITTVSGIGAAKLFPVEGKWPANITIRLAVKSLESFEIKTPKQLISGSLGHSEILVISKTKDYIDIIVPQSILDEKPDKLEISWIDAYRN